MSKQYKSSEATRLAISSAMKELMAVKPLEKITITEIMNACGMRRQHFYYYFTSVYDLLRWMLEREALDILRQQENLLHWRDGLLFLFQYIDKNRSFCLCVLDSLGREYLKRLLETDINDLVRQAIHSIVVNNHFPHDDAYEAIIARFLTIALAGTAEGWLRGEFQYTPEELIDMLCVIFQDYANGVALRLNRPLTAGPQV